MSKLDLCLDADDFSDELVINKAYAESYDNWRHLEELQKLKSKYGNVAEDVGDDDESSSSEEPAVRVFNFFLESFTEKIPDLWSGKHERDFLRTLSALKTHDPKLYSNEKFFTAEISSSSIEKTIKGKKKNAPMFLKDYERKLVLEKGGNISEDEKETKTSKPGYYEQQELIKQELKFAVANQNDDMEPLFRQRIKTEEEMKNEEDQYYEWLKGQGNEDLPGIEELKGLKEAWNDMNLDESEKFLRDYLLYKKYDVEGNDGIPMYDEIVNVEKDEEELEKGTEFERKYNFRYEELDQDFIKQYPRTVKQSLRKKDERRKQKRDAYRERKKLEKQTRKDEIKELRALKKKEIGEKLKKLKKLAGDDDLSLDIDDLEADFDPAVYDKRMKEVFSSEYYDKVREGDEEKPIFSDTSADSSSESEYDTLNVNKEGEKNEIEMKNGGHGDSGIPTNGKILSQKKRRRNLRFLEAVMKKKPLFNPDEKSFEEYFNEYYALDYEDVIADGLITKFKYRSVPANDFGITIDELFNADDRQLNAWASLKKVTAYRSEAEELYDIKAYKKKALNISKKKRIFNTDFGGKKSKKVALNNATVDGAGHADKIDQVAAKEKKMTRKNSQKLKNLDAGEQKRNITALQEKVQTPSGRMWKQKNRSAFEEFSSTIIVDDSRLRAYGINPKKYKNKLFRRKLVE
uniref:Protein KRI1 homolog n=1 Tax=Setaria digitata TaxID=48799 RepID=A0A915PDI5_9BILA